MDDEADFLLDWIKAAQVWACVLCVVGGVGNGLTLATITHQFYLWGQRKGGRKTQKNRTREGSTVPNLEKPLQTRLQLQNQHCKQQASRLRQRQQDQRHQKVCELAESHIEDTSQMNYQISEQLSHIEQRLQLETFQQEWQQKASGVEPKEQDQQQPEQRPSEVEQREWDEQGQPEYKQRSSQTEKKQQMEHSQQAHEQMSSQCEQDQQKNRQQQKQMNQRQWPNFKQNNCEQAIHTTCEEHDSPIQNPSCTPSIHPRERCQPPLKNEILLKATSQSLLEINKEEMTPLGQQKKFFPIRISSRSLCPVLKPHADTLILLHLILCDFLYCTINLPLTYIIYDYPFQGNTANSSTSSSNFSTYNITDQFVSSFNPPSKEFCTVVGVIRYLIAFVEWMTLGLLTVQRCVDLRRHRGTKVFTPRNTIILLALCWVTAFTLQIRDISKGNYDYITATYKCDMTKSSSLWIFFTLETAVPSLLITVGGSSIIYQLWQCKRHLVQSNMPKDLVEKRSRETRKSTALVLGLVLLFLLCVDPIAVYNLYILITYNPGSFYSEYIPRESIATGITIYMIYWIQYGVNFLVFIASNRNFRRAYCCFFAAIWERIRCLCPKMKENAKLGGNERCKSSPSGAQLKSDYERNITRFSIPVIQIDEASDATLDYQEINYSNHKTSARSLSYWPLRTESFCSSLNLYDSTSTLVSRLTLGHENTLIP